MAEYYSTRLDNGVKALEEMAAEWQAKHGRPAKALLLNPKATGAKVAALIEAAERLGLEVERRGYVLAWEMWVGG